MSSHPKLSPTALIAHLEWRYATKVFDASKTIAPDIWSALERTLVLSPSSFGLQPWKFIVVTNKEVKEKLRAHSWKQAQVTDCSHYVVFATIQKLDETHIDEYFALLAEKHSTSVESYKGYRGVMVGDLIHGARSKVIAEWAARQAYIALGNFMTAAAVLGVDTCPMEGFVPAEYDKILDLEKQGLTSAVCCAVGYRSEKDKYATLPKVRYSHDKLVRHI